MSELTITAKVQILTDDVQGGLLYQTMSVYRDACDFVSTYVFSTHDLIQSSLHKALYYDIRNKFGLKSQMSQSVIKTVIARYKTILENQKEWILPVFKKPQLDLVWNRDYSLTQDAFSVNTLAGRIKVGFYKGGMEKYFDKSLYKFGTATLVYKHNKYFLHIPVTFDVKDCELTSVAHIVGIDRGVNFLATMYDSAGKTMFVNGRNVKQRRAAYVRLRKELQMRKTPSSRRRLKRIGQRENRWMQDVNHCVSKALVESNPVNTLFVLEDLKDINKHVRERVKLKNQRYFHVTWAFYDLSQKLEYKALMHQQSVIFVNPAYTSQCCPKCGHTEKSNRDKKNHLFRCKTCGYMSNDDRIGAMNLYRKGIDYVVSHTVPDTVTNV